MKPYELPPLSDIDAGIRDLVLCLNQPDDFCTGPHSCEGHKRGDTTDLTLMVRGVRGMRHLAKLLNAVADTPPYIWPQASMIYHADVAGSEGWIYPDKWYGFDLMLSRTRGKPLTSVELAQLTEAFKKHI